MVSAPARASSISARRIVALADEFLLLRAQMSAMQRQFESVLAEIAMELPRSLRAPTCRLSSASDLTARQPVGPQT